MASKTIDTVPPTLQDLIAARLVGEDDRTPEEIVASILEQTMKAESVDDLFSEVTSAKDEFTNIPFICEDIEFRKSSVGDSPYYALLACRTRDEKRHVVSCSAPDVYSKILKLMEFGVLDSTPLVIRSKQTSKGFDVLKLERVSQADWDSGELF